MARGNNHIRVERPCERCGAHFLAYHNRNRFCSATCRGDVPKTIVACVRCGIEPTYAPRAIYCSGCLLINQRESGRRASRRAASMRTCVVCSGPIPFGRRLRAYCSEPCAKMGQTAGNAARLYGIDATMAVSALRSGRCAFDHQADRIDVDHDHGTGAFRGFLCTRHNTGLGLFNDSIEELEQAIAYLRAVAVAEAS